MGEDDGFSGAGGERHELAPYAPNLSSGYGRDCPPLVRTQSERGCRRAALGHGDHGAPPRPAKSGPARVSPASKRDSVQAGDQSGGSSSQAVGGASPTN